MGWWSRRKARRAARKSTPSSSAYGSSGTSGGSTTSSNYSSVSSALSGTGGGTLTKTSSSGGSSSSSSRSSSGGGSSSSSTLGSSNLAADYPAVEQPIEQSLQSAGVTSAETGRLSPSGGTSSGRLTPVKTTSSYGAYNPSKDTSAWSRGFTALKGGNVKDAFNQFSTKKGLSGEDKVFVSSKFGDIDISGYSKLQQRAYANALGEGGVQTKTELQSGADIERRQVLTDVDVGGQNLYEETIVPQISSRITGYQAAVDEGTLDVETAQTMLDKEIVDLTKGFETSAEYIQLTDNAKDKYKSIKSYDTTSGKSSMFGDLVKTGELALSFTPPGAAIELAKASQKDTQKAQAKALAGLYGGKTDTYSGGGKLSLNTAIAAGGVALIGGGSALGSFRSIEKGLVADELSALSSSKIKFKTNINKGTGLSETFAVQEYGGLTKTTEITGLIKRTESGKFLIPEGTISSEISGDLAWNIRGGLDGSKFIGTQIGNFGSSSAGVFAGTKGEVDIFSTISKSTITPISETSAIFKIPRTLRGASKEGKLIGKQLANIKYGGETIKSFETGAFLKTKPQVGFDTAATKDSTGVIFEIEKSSEKTIGKKFTGGKRTPFADTFKVEKPDIKFETTTPKSTSSQSNVLVEGKIEPPKLGTSSPTVKGLKQYSVNEIKVGTRSRIIPKVGLGVQSLGQKINILNKQSFIPLQKLSPKIDQIQVPKLDTFQIQSPRTSLKTGVLTPTLNVSGLSTGFSPKIASLGGFGLFAGLPKPNLQFKRPGGVGKFKGGRDYGYIQSFGGWFTGKVGKTKGLMIGGREVYTGMEVRGREVKKKK